MPETVFKGPDLHPRQTDLYNALKAHKYTLAYGSARGGKSYTIADFMIGRALVYPKSSHLVLRLVGSSIKGSIWAQTFLKVLEAYGIRDKVDINLTDLTITFENGSIISFTGVQDDERIQKLLGAEYQTIFFNEATNIEYEVYETVATRLNGSIPNEAGTKTCALKIIADCNPTTKSFWLYQLFCEKVVPNTSRAVFDPSEYGEIYFDADANPAADYSGYRDKSAATQRRFLEGVWTDEVQGALFSLDDLDNNRCDTPDLNEFDLIVVGVDPAMTNTPASDETGIIVAGMVQEGDQAHYYPLADLSGRYHPHEWARIVSQAYRHYGAGIVVIEINQGGEQNVHTLHTADPSVVVVTVNPGRGQGKNMRAMPIASLTRDGLIHFPLDETFKELEGQLLSMTGDFDRKRKKSPDRADAFCYAISELLTGDGPVKPVVISKIANYFA